MSDLLDLPLRAQALALSNGEVSCVELAAWTLKRIDKREPDLHTIVDIDADLVLAAAAKHDAIRCDERAPLAGLMFGVKDIIDVKYRPTRCGSFAQPTDVAGTDAACVTALCASGMTPAAKLATYEYALNGPAWDQPNPPARNPWDVDHITGGSSSGSAAAVAGGLFRVALGTDTGGSIRAPAANCGVVGLKPTGHATPVEGVFALSPSLDCVGPIAASVEDAALVYDALRPQSKTPVTERVGRDIKGLQIGYARDWFVHDPATHPAVTEAMDVAASALSQLGAKIDLVQLPDYDAIEAAGSVIMKAESLIVHTVGLAERFDQYGVDARRTLIAAAILTEHDLAVAHEFAARTRQAIDTALAPFSALITPTTLVPAPAFADFSEGAVWTPMRTLPFNVSGHPSLSVPCGFAGHLPLGMQIVGRHGDEATLCQIGHAFEISTHHLARPPIGDRRG